MRRTLPTLAIVVSILGACGSPTPGDGGPADAGAGGGDAGVAGLGLFARLKGVWSGQAGQTPLGSFPQITMDYQAEGGSWLFGRVDLDAQDSLRYGFAVEDISGAPTLVFRNGGYFQGMLRDTTLVLVGADESAGSYHFCAQPNACLYVNGSCIEETGACGFVDALFTFNGSDQLVFNAHVNGQEHEVWTATRVEQRQLPSPFPPEAAPLPSDTDWPPMPQLSVTVTWASPLQGATDVWVILSDTPCASGSCTPLRALSTQAPAGATSASLTFDQIHPGAYDANALVDLSGSFGVSLSPSPGDLISVPPDQPVTVAAQGPETLSLSASYPFP
ncbi:MAG: hypothetical protein ACYDCL_14450 [Myxococcales bacterium]